MTSTLRRESWPQPPAWPARCLDRLPLKWRRRLAAARLEPRTTPAQSRRALLKRSPIQPCAIAVVCGPARQSHVRLLSLFDHGRPRSQAFRLCGGENYLLLLFRESLQAEHIVEPDTTSPGGGHQMLMPRTFPNVYDCRHVSCWSRFDRCCAGSLRLCRRTLLSRGQRAVPRIFVQIVEKFISARVQ